LPVLLGSDAVKLPRRRFLHLAAGAAALSSMPQIAQAQAYPSRSVRIIVGFAPGIAPDLAARLIAAPLSERIGQQVIVDNRPGAGSNLAAEIVVRAPADGYTLLLATSANTINATLYKKLNFDFTHDIAPVAAIATAPYLVVVNPSFPAKTVSEFIAYAKGNPGKVNFASAGVGTGGHVPVELFKMMSGIDMAHVPYRTSYYPDLLAGQVQLAFANTAASIGYVRVGQLHALAVTTATRVPVLPEIPTVGEFVPGYEASGWYGIGAPRGTSIAIIEKLNIEINAVVADPKVRDRLIDLGNVPVSMTAAEFGKFIADETEKWAKVITFANIKPE
jgi:tripartite-type tricarboxylate transporter receptor subunit TctC